MPYFSDGPTEQYCTFKMVVANYAKLSKSCFMNEKEGHLQITILVFI